MKRFLGPLTFPLILIAPLGCQPARAQLRTPPASLSAPRVASSGWQPNYLASRPAASPYSPVSTASARWASAPASPAAPSRAESPGLHRLEDASASRPRPQLTRSGPPGAHAPDFRWVVGRLEHDAQRDRWYVRYAPAGPNDPRGGTVDLIGTQARAGLVAGTMVRAEGAPLGPAPRTGPRPYLPSRVLVLPAGGGR